MAATEPAPADEPIEAEAVAPEAAVQEAAIETVIETIEEEVPAEAAPPAKELYCPACGAAVHVDDTFCGNCGASLGEPEPELVEAVPITEAVVVEEEVIEPIIEEAPVEVIDDDLETAEPITAPAAESIVAEEPTITEMPLAEEPLVEQPSEEQVIEEPAVAEAVEAPAEEEVRCSVCGATVLSDQRFCASCGAALQPAPEAAATPSSPVQPLVSSVSAGPYLEVIASGAHIPLVDQPEVLVGRVDDVSGIYPDIDMTPHGGEEGGVSRQHARLLHEGDVWSIMDLDSTNGTFINEIELEAKVRTALNDGDRISLGDVEIVYHAG
jgi:predicted component of type VI protein secretion system